MGFKEALKNASKKITVKNKPAPKKRAPKGGCRK